MGLGKLNIWIRYEKGVTWSCRVDTENWPPWNGWKVTIKDCTGRILEWCGKRYSLIGPTKHGHLEVEVPPGSYIISALSGATGCNTYTAPAYVQVGCDECVCVNLLAPIQHYCAWYYIAGVRQAVRDEVIPKEVAERAIATAKEVLKYVPKPTLRPGETPVEEDIEEIEGMLRKKK